MKIKIFRRTALAVATDPQTFAKDQKLCQIIVHQLVPSNYYEIKREESKLQSLLEKKGQIEDKYTDVFDENGLRPEYLNEKVIRRRVIYSATLLEGVATGFTFHMMLGLPLLFAISIGLIVAAIVFYFASAEKVLSKNTSAKRNWLIIAAYNFIIALVGIILGILSDIDYLYLVVHIVLSGLSFFCIYTALNHAEQYSKDCLISIVKKKYNKVINDINKCKARLTKLNEELTKLINVLREKAIDCHNQFRSYNSDERILILDPTTRIVLNNILKIDVFPPPESGIKLTTLPSYDRSCWSNILSDHGYVQNQNIPQISEKAYNSNSNSLDSTINANYDITSNNDNESSNQGTDQRCNNRINEINTIPDAETEL